MMPFKNPAPKHMTRHGRDLVEVTCSRFVGSSGTQEYNFMLKPLRYGHFSDQLEWLDSAMQNALEEYNLNRNGIVFRRFFCSDLPNQEAELRRHPFCNPDGVANGAVSLVNQPPVAPAKATLWVYCVKDPTEQNAGTKNGTSFSLTRGDLKHVWTTGCTAAQATGSHAQTNAIFKSYLSTLEQDNMTLEENCLRTWFYVKDVDANYNGLVVARNEIFDTCGLTKDTHFIASTGIQGSSADIDSLVMMDAYAIKGVQPGQVQHLQALEYLSHTHKYGVAFERATAISYADRKHVMISGTASIDSEGKVVHVGDVMRQLDRTLLNISALLDQANATMDDMQYFIVYLRDPSDAEIIRDILKERIGDKPFLVVTGPVCRPEWLIEIEGIATIHNTDDALPAF
jgi:enamine deaminase RidA (YjgF/YER057c/UK114 family)